MKRFIPFALDNNPELVDDPISILVIEVAVNDREVIAVVVDVEHISIADREALYHRHGLASDAA